MSEYTLPPLGLGTARFESSDSVAVKRVMSFCYFSYVNIINIIQTRNSLVKKF